MSLARLWHAFRQPVRPETRANLRRLWAELPEPVRTPAQLAGRQWEGCGATLGAMPRCDFACTACYLGGDANRTPPASLDEVREQLRLIRTRVGWRGNVQLTDGEVALRPTAEVIELVRAARQLDLIPMLMTHGDGFRADPARLERLERLVVEGGLAEIGLHVDTTQRGRAGYPRPANEAELHPVRAELADIVRSIRRRTGRELRAAATVTVTPDNVDGVPDVVRWTLENSDVYRMLSFQPVAQVGRTHARGGTSREALWRAIAAGLGENADAPTSAWNSPQVFGHPACTHVVMGSVWRARGKRPRFVPLRDPTCARSDKDLAWFFARFGGLSFRADGRAEAAARALGVLVAAPGMWLRRGPGWARRTLARFEPGAPLRAARYLATGRAKVGAFALVSHHFMDAAELASPEGREREAACVFRAPVDGELVSMCRVNATGLREARYRSLRERAENRPPEPLPR